MQGTIVSTNISIKKGTVKVPVPEGITLIVDIGVEGDAHAGAEPLRQVSLLAEESIDKMKLIGADVEFGSFAENITTSGIDIVSLPVGTKLRCGEIVVIEITQIGKKCHHGCEIMKQVGDCIMPREGIFAKVVTGGIVRPGDVLATMDSTEGLQL